MDQTPDGETNVKLYDLGLAVVASTTLHAVCGTPTYMAPEMIRGSGFVLSLLAVVDLSLHKISVIRCILLVLPASDICSKSSQ